MDDRILPAISALGQRLVNMENKFDWYRAEMNTRITNMETDITSVNTKITDMNTKITNMETQILTNCDKLDRIEKKLDSLQAN